MNLVKFCDHYRQIGADIADIAVWFLWAALAVAVAAAIAEIIAKVWPAGDATAKREEGAAVVGLIEAIKGLVTALAAAPLWIALFAAGLLMFAVPGVAVSALCTEEPKTDNPSAGDKASQTKTRTPAATATPCPAPIGDRSGACICTYTCTSGSTG